MVGELKNGEVREYEVHPERLRPAGATTAALKVADTGESVACLQRALANEDGPVRDIVLLNAGAALYGAGVRRLDGRRRDAGARGVASGAARGQARAVRRGPTHRPAAASAMSDILQRIVAVKREEVGGGAGAAHARCRCGATREAARRRATSKRALRAQIAGGRPR